MWIKWCLLFTGVVSLSSSVVNAGESQRNADGSQQNSTEPQYSEVDGEMEGLIPMPIHSNEDNTARLAYNEDLHFQGQDDGYKVGGNSWERFRGEDDGVKGADTSNSGYYAIGSPISPLEYNPPVDIQEGDEDSLGDGQNDVDTIDYSGLEQPHDGGKELESSNSSNVEASSSAHPAGNADGFTLDNPEFEREKDSEGSELEDKDGNEDEAAGAGAGEKKDIGEQTEKGLHELFNDQEKPQSYWQSALNKFRGFWANPEDSVSSESELILSGKTTVDQENEQEGEGREQGQKEGENEDEHVDKDGSEDEDENENENDEDGDGDEDEDREQEEGNKDADSTESRMLGKEDYHTDPDACTTSTPLQLFTYLAGLVYESKKREDDHADKQALLGGEKALDGQEALESESKLSADGKRPTPESELESESESSDDKKASGTEDAIGKQPPDSRLKSITTDEYRANAIWEAVRYQHDPLFQENMFAVPSASRYSRKQRRGSTRNAKLRVNYLKTMDSRRGSLERMGPAILLSIGDTLLRVAPILSTAYYFGALGASDIANGLLINLIARLLMDRFAYDDKAEYWGIKAFIVLLASIYGSEVATLLGAPL